MCVRERIEYRECRVTPGEDLGKVKSGQKSAEAEYGCHISKLCSHLMNDELRSILKFGVKYFKKTDRK